MTESAAELLTKFGDRFVLQAEYASGEGRTLRVAQKGADRALVLKVLPLGIEAAEASLLLSLQHPSIPAIREVGRLPDGRAFVVRDHVEGTVLRTLPSVAAELTSFVQQLLEVLAYVHLRGVLHLDLKPANLLVDDSGRVHLLDFGLGVRGGERARGGTPFFAAPEILLGGVPDARADLFSVGAMVAQALWPGSGPPLPHFVRRFPTDSFFAAGGLREADLAAPFDRFVARCVSRRPARRFADAQSALEFLCGGSGRPATALLAPDPVLLFAPELQRVGDDATADPVLCGADADDRMALAMHLAATLPGVRQIVASGSELRVRRGGRHEQRLDLPRLDAPRLLLHLQQAFGLQGNAALDTARWLVQQTATGAASVHALLLALVDTGEIVPSGSRWTWPAARGGRLREAAMPIARGVATVEQVRAAASSGRREQAIAMWQAAAAATPAAEPEFRRALAEGLLDGGEPAQALPFCGGLPVLRAQALLDTGQIAAASRELAAEASPPASARHRRVAAQLAMAVGDRDGAVRILEHPGATPLERVMLGAALEQAGRLADSEHVLQRCAAELSPAEQPFATASLCTALGHVLRQRGDLRGARHQFEIASELLYGIGHVRHAASAQLNLGVIAKDLGEHGLAVERLREARTLYQQVGDAARAAIAAANLGITALARGDAAAALPWLLEGSTTLSELGDVAAGQLALVMLARAHAELGEHQEAEGILQQLAGPGPGRVADEIVKVRALLQKAAAPAALAKTPMSESPPADAGPSRELFRTFLAVNRHLAQETDLDKAMRRLLDAAVTLTGGRMGYLLVAREDGMRREFQSGDAGPVGQAFSRSLANRAMQQQRTLTGADALADREMRDAPSIRNLEIRSAVCAPFRSAGGTVGALYVEHPGRAGAFAATDKEALEMLADQAAIAVDRMLREQAIASELTASRRELAVVRRTTRRTPTQLLGDSKPMVDLRAQIDKLAPLDLPVLVLGETGTGKEIVARALHERSHRNRGPFVAENCSALPADLMERELFGHVQGAFTGADADRQGLLELASGGTLFLDEVGDMPPALQAKLLRVLQEQTIRRVGGTESVQLDLRLIAATHKDLRAMVARGEFREDLFFRLAAVELRMPPLRDRGHDVLQLAEHFVRRHGEQRGRTLRLSPVVKAAFASYAWPGNVRELEHVIARATLLCDGDEIADAQLPRATGTPIAATGAADAASATNTATEPVQTLKEAERRAMIVALQSCGGDKAKTARVLGISRTALYEKIKRHGLDA